MSYASISNYTDEVEGFCKARIYYGDDEYEEVELTYYGYMHSDGLGYVVHVTRPDVPNAVDLMYDVIQALHDDGIRNVNEIIWL